jgi:phage terminase Nu1 subunit (DNA packaging protein)
VVDREQEQANLPVIAKLLMISTRRVQQLAQEGVIPKAAHGQYNLVACVQGYIHYLQSKERQGAKRLDEDARLRAAQADLRTFELQKARGQYVALTALDSAMVDVVRTLCGGVDAMPARLMADLDSRQRKRVIDECDRVRESVAAGLGALSERYAAMARGGHAPKKAERRGVGRRKPRAAEGAGRARAVSQQPDAVSTAAG